MLLSIQVQQPFLTSDSPTAKFISPLPLADHEDLYIRVLYMTILPSQDAKSVIRTSKSAQINPSPLPQSQELGQALPDFKVDNGDSVTTRVSPLGKSWAHFVAGG